MSSCRRIDEILVHVGDFIVLVSFGAISGLLFGSDRVSRDALGIMFGNSLVPTGSLGAGWALNSNALTLCLGSGVAPDGARRYLNLFSVF